MPKTFFNSTHYGHHGRPNSSGKPYRLSGIGDFSINEMIDAIFDGQKDIELNAFRCMPEDTPIRLLWNGVDYSDKWDGQIEIFDADA